MASGLELAKAFVKVGVDDSGVKSGLSSVLQQARRLGPLIAAAFGAVSTAMFVRQGINGVRQQIREERKLEQVLAATGKAAGVTANEIYEIAGALQKVTNFGDDATISAATMIATFGTIKGDNFKRTIEIAQDLAEVMGMSLPAAARMMGRSLSDPQIGMMMMRRAGIMLTQEQQAVIQMLTKTGETAKAQGLLLDAMAGKVGGAARAMADPIIQFGNNAGDVAEVLGQTLLPTLNMLIGHMLGVQEAAMGMDQSARSVGRDLAVLFEAGGKAFWGALTQDTKFSEGFQKAVAEEDERWRKQRARLAEVRQNLEGFKGFDLGDMQSQETITGEIDKLRKSLRSVNEDEWQKMITNFMDLKPSDEQRRGFTSMVGSLKDMTETRDGLKEVQKSLDALKPPTERFEEAEKELRRLHKMSGGRFDLTQSIENRRSEIFKSEIDFVKTPIDELEEKIAGMKAAFDVGAITSEQMLFGAEKLKKEFQEAKKDPPKFEFVGIEDFSRRIQQQLSGEDKATKAATDTAKHTKKANELLDELIETIGDRGPAAFG